MVDNSAPLWLNKDMTPTQPLFKEMTDSELRSAYRVERDNLYNVSNFANHVSPKSRGGRMIARQWGRALRNVEIIEAIARKRGVRLIEVSR